MTGTIAQIFAGGRNRTAKSGDACTFYVYQVNSAFFNPHFTPGTGKE
jgi:hypothetical protein